MKLTIFLCLSLFALSSFAQDRKVLEMYSGGEEELTTGSYRLNIYLGHSSFLEELWMRVNPNDKCSYNFVGMNRKYAIIDFDVKETNVTQDKCELVLSIGPFNSGLVIVGRN